MDVILQRVRGSELQTLGATTLKMLNKHLPTESFTISKIIQMPFYFIFLLNNMSWIMWHVCLLKSLSCCYRKITHLNEGIDINLSFVIAGTTVRATVVEN